MLAPLFLLSARTQLSSLFLPPFADLSSVFAYPFLRLILNFNSKYDLIATEYFLNELKETKSHSFLTERIFLGEQAFQYSATRDFNRQISHHNLQLFEVLEFDHLNCIVLCTPRIRQNLSGLFFAISSKLDRRENPLKFQAAQDSFKLL